MACHLLLEEPIGSMLTAKVRVFSNSFFCTGPRVLDRVSASQIWGEKAEAVVKSTDRKDRNDIAGQPIDIEWHVCPGDNRANAANAQTIHVGHWARI